MNADAQVTDVPALSDADLGSLLERLEGEERTISRRRSALHNRIDFIRGGGAASAEPAADQLASLCADERGLSDRRHLLHSQIDDLRAERGRRLADQPPA